MLACSASGSTHAFAASVLPSVRSMAAVGWPAAVALMPKQWTQLWQGQLSEETYTPAHSSQCSEYDSAERQMLQDEHADEEPIED